MTSRVLARPVRDQRSADRFTEDLERETDRSLATDPTRWPWRRSTAIADRHRSTRGRCW